MYWPVNLWIWISQCVHNVQCMHYRSKLTCVFIFVIVVTNFPNNKCMYWLVNLWIYISQCVHIVQCIHYRSKLTCVFIFVIVVTNFPRRPI